MNTQKEIQKEGVKMKLTLRKKNVGVLKLEFPSKRNKKIC